MNPRIHRVFLLAIMVLLSACGRNGQTAAPAGAGAPSPAPAPDSPLLNPHRATAKAPDVYKVHLTTTKGDLVIEVHRAWAPIGADRFYNLVQIGYYDGNPLFRVLPTFMVQFGINPLPAVNEQWRDAVIPDDPPAGQSNTRGMVSFATRGPASRTTQVFINYVDNARLDASGFVPFGQVVSGMKIADSFYAGYGEGTPNGNGPDQGRLQREGGAYTHADFPQMDYIQSAKIEP
jgi:peptidyl-prolyl cis-trans isomerase A (cyclophilin A)